MWVDATTEACYGTKTEGICIMAKNEAKHVSLQTFAKAYAKIQKSGGTVIDLMNECEMVNVGSVRQKINHLREAFPDLKPLKRQGRSSNSGQTAAQEAAAILSALFADDNEESSDTDEKTEETDTEENDTEEMTTTETNDSAAV